MEAGRTKQNMTLRLSPHGRRLLMALAAKHGVSMAAIVEIVVRRVAEYEGVTVAGEERDDEG